MATTVVADPIEFHQRMPEKLRRSCQVSAYMVSVYDLFRDGFEGRALLLTFESGGSERFRT